MTGLGSFWRLSSTATRTSGRGWSRGRGPLGIRRSCIGRWAPRSRDSAGRRPPRRPDRPFGGGRRRSIAMIVLAGEVGVVVRPGADLGLLGGERRRRGAAAAGPTYALQPARDSYWPPRRSWRRRSGWLSA